MSLFTKLCESFRSWRRRRGGPKTTKRASVALEHLGHRQLLAVNFTGNVITDFPATQQPGVVVLPDNAAVIHPIFATNTPQQQQVANIIKVSGFDIKEIRLSYTPADDSLSIGLGQPNNQISTPARPVLAGDADNNGDSGTVNPAVSALIPGFQDPGSLGGSETMGAFLKLNPLSQYDIVAGYSSNAISPKQYTVAMAQDASTPGVFPGSNFGTSLPTNTGNVFLVNDQSHPNLEFSIRNFSVLYKAQTGQTLTGTSTFSIGAFGSSLTDSASGAIYPLTMVTLSQITPPVTPPPPVCPPLSPPILINPHQARHVNTAHNGDVKVYVFGSSGFPVRNIDPNSVRLGGATPYAATIRHVNRDEFDDEVFVFKGSDIHLPPGITVATLTGNITDANIPTQINSFSSAQTIFNRDFSSYPPAAVARQKTKLGLTDTTTPTQTTPTTPSGDMSGATVTPATVAIPLRTGSPAPTTYTPTPSPASSGSLKPLLTKAIPLRTQQLPTMTPTVMVASTTQTKQPTKARGSAARARHISNVHLKSF